MRLPAITGKLHRCLRHLPAQLRTLLPECASSGCPRRHAWQKFRSPARVLVEGEPFCPTPCLQRALERRFLECLPTERIVRPAHRLPLGLLLVARGWLDPPQLQAGLALQRRRGGRLGECLAALDFVAESHITAVLAIQWCCPVLTLRSPLDLQLLSLLPRRVLERNRMIPVHYAVSKRLLSLAFTDGVDYALLNAVGRMLTCSTQACLIPESSFKSEIARLCGCEARGEAIFDKVADASERARITLNYAHSHQADQIRIVACGAAIWARVSRRESPADIVFDNTAP